MDSHTLDHQTSEKTKIESNLEAKVTEAELAQCQNLLQQQMADFDSQITSIKSANELEMELNQTKICKILK